MDDVRSAQILNKIDRLCFLAGDLADQLHYLRAELRKIEEEVAHEFAGGKDADGS